MCHAVSVLCNFFSDKWDLKFKWKTMGQPGLYYKVKYNAERRQDPQRRLLTIIHPSLFIPKFFTGFEQI
jgi:hypothetical protein